MSAQRTVYEPRIDGLRAIAVTSVVLYHGDIPGFAGGFVGVDVFFVISGFLITSILAGEYANSGTISVLNFYRRRVQRLLPASLAMILIIVLLGAVLTNPLLGEPQAIAASAWWSLAFQANHYFLWNSGGYFDGPSVELPLLHMWSLAVEEQFYLVWPIALLVLLKFVPHRLRAIALFAAFCLSFVINVYFMKANPQVAFLMMPCRAWELLAGALLAQLTIANRLRGLRLAASVVGLGAIVAAITTFDDYVEFPGYLALIPTLGATALLFGIAGPSSNLVDWLLGSRLFVYVGQLSYSWYLWHWPIFALYRVYALDNVPQLNGIVLAACSFIAAMASFYLIERPLRGVRNAHSVSGAARIVGFGLVASAGVALIVAGVLSSARGQVSATLSNKSDERAYEAMFAHQDRAQAKPCLDPRLKQPITFCDIGNASGLVVYWGDSHAMAWHEFFKRFADNAHLGLVGIVRNACPPAPGFENVRDPPGAQRDCLEHNKAALRLILSGQILGVPIRQVIITGRVPQYWSYYDYRRWMTLPMAQRAQHDTDMAAGIKYAVGQITTRTSASIFVLAPVPELRNTAPRCVLSDLEYWCTMTRGDYIAARQIVFATYEKLATLSDRVHVIDPLDFFCPTDHCLMRREGSVLYVDDDHVSASAGRDFFVYWRNKSNPVE